MSEVKDGRNSPLRKLFHYPVDQIVIILDRLGFSADTITKFGLLGNGVSTFVVAKDGQKDQSERLPWVISTLILLLPKLLDLLDGSLARKQGTNNPQLDVVSDRLSETISYLAIMKTNPRACKAALSALITTPLPSLAKARAESQGKVVPEFSLGSYPVRTGLTTAALVIPEQADKILTVESVANIITTASRLNPQKDQALTGEAKKISQDRFHLLLGLTAISITAGLAVSGYLKSKESNQ
jgi:phosphatidylglycerophosphate synthase